MAKSKGKGLFREVKGKIVESVEIMPGENGSPLCIPSFPSPVRPLSPRIDAKSDLTWCELQRNPATLGQI